MKQAALVACLLSLFCAAALAGGSDLEGGEADAELGASYFGEAKDIKGMKPLEGVRVSAQRKGKPLPVFASTDEDGRFKIPGFGKDVNSDDIVVNCAKSGWRLVDLARRKTGADGDAPVEIECLFEKQ